MPTYASMFAEIGGNFMLFGGLLFPDTPTNAIYSASIGSPLSWSITGVLPYPAAHGQFVAIGNDGYIISPMSNPVPTTTYTPIVQCSLSNPNSWIYVQQVVPGNISHSQLAIIYDRIWLFGGSGLTAMFACNQKLKYSLTSLHSINYGHATRTVVPATDNLNNPFQALSMPWWLTDYKFPGRP
jgi:hypothetical protein